MGEFNKGLIWTDLCMCVCLMEGLVLNGLNVIIKIGFENFRRIIWKIILGNFAFLMILMLLMICPSSFTVERTQGRGLVYFSAFVIHFR